MSLFTKIRNAVEGATLIPAAVQVGGASLGNVAKNALSGDRLTKHAGGAAAADVAGLTAGFALGPTGIAQTAWGAPAAYGGEEAAAALPEQLGGPTALEEAAAVGGPDVGATGEVPGGVVYGGENVVGQETADTAGLAGYPPGSAEAGGAAAPSAAGGVGNAVARYGPLALGAAGLASNALAGRAAAKRIGQIGQAQRDAGNQLINQYNSGQLTVADAHAIDQYEASATAQAKQYFARSGQSTSTAANSTLATIQGNVAAMKSQALQNYLKLGTSMLNVTDQYQLAAIEQEMANDRAMWNQLFNFGATYGQWNRSLAQMTA